MLKGIKNIHQFKGWCQLRVWLYQIAKNTYFSYYKKHKKPSKLTIEIQIESFEKRLMNKAKAFKFHQIIYRLDEPYKEVFNLRIFGDLSFAQIGELFNKSGSWGRVTFHRAKLKIKEALK